MCKKNNCTLHTWGKDLAVENNLYCFENPITVSSVRLQKDTPIEEIRINGNGKFKSRTFKRGRLVTVNEEQREFVFIGHKIPENGHKKTNKKYLFALSS